MIGIICPSLFEYRALDRAKLKKAGVPVLLSGMGKLRAILGALKLYEKHPGLEGILLVGFAGGLTPNLCIGDVLEPLIFIEQDYCAEPFEKFPNKIQLGARRKLVRESRRAVLLTQDRFLTENPYKGGKLTHRFSTIGCDMESYAVAKFCLEKKIRFGAIKLVSDVADETASHDFLAACRRLAPKLNRTVLAAVKSFAKNFSGLKKEIA